MSHLENKEILSYGFMSALYRSFAKAHMLLITLTKILFRSCVLVNHDNVTVNQLVQCQNPEIEAVTLTVTSRGFILSDLNFPHLHSITVFTELLLLPMISSM